MTRTAMVTRKSDRLRVQLRARCRAEEGDEAGVTLVNISAEGCCMDVAEGAVQPGLPVTIRLATGGSYPGTVRWVENGQAGVEFDRVLPLRVVRYLRIEHSTFMSEMSEVDWSAKRSIA